MISFLQFLYALGIFKSNFNHIILKNFPPTREIKIVGILMPGYQVPPNDYKDLSKEIQTTAKKNNLYLDIIIANVQNTTTASYEKSIDEIVDYIDLSYPPDKKTFLIAHSAGATFSSNKAMEKCDFFIRMGSLFNSKNILPNANTVDSFPKPVLTILGQNDGLLKYTLASYELAALEQKIKTLGYDYLSVKKPIVIIPGLTHMQMAKGNFTEIAKKLGMKDLDTNLTLKDAHSKIARVVADFLGMNVGSTNNYFVKNSFKNTSEILKKYQAFIKYDYLSALISNIQQLLAPPPILFKFYNNWNYNLDLFLYSKPEIYNNTIITQSFINNTPAFNENAFFNCLWLKLKSQQAITNSLSVLQNVTAQSINARIFNATFEILTAHQQQNYLLLGKKLSFGQDIITQPGPNLEWFKTNIKLTNLNNSFILQSPTMYTNTTVIPERFDGMYYVKVITPAQVVDWVTFHSLK